MNRMGGREQTKSINVRRAALSHTRYMYAHDAESKQVKDGSVNKIVLFRRRYFEALSRYRN